MRGPPGGLQDGEEMVQKVGEDEGSPQSVGGTLKQRVTGEGKGGMPFHDWQRVPPAPPGDAECPRIQGWVAGGGPIHDWQRSSPAEGPPSFTQKPAADERVEEASTGPCRPAAAAVNSQSAPFTKLEDATTYFTGGSAEAAFSFSGRFFSELGEPILKSLQQLTWNRTCKTMPMAQDVLFPMPLGDYPGVHPDKMPWLHAILLGLNSFYGVGWTSNAEPTALQKQVAASVLVYLDRMWAWTEVIPVCSFGDLFRVKGVDYRGEEIKLARSFSWQSIAGASPLRWLR